MSEGVIRVKTWAEFKRLVTEHNPEAIVYNVEQNAFSSKRELTSLRLILPSVKTQYVLLDFPKGDALRETHIPFRKDKNGNHYIDEEDVKRFLRNEFKREDLTICAYWTI
jgi:hypothetical protein